MKGAYYNEWEPYAAQWLRNLIAGGMIPASQRETRRMTIRARGRLAGVARRRPQVQRRKPRRPGGKMDGFLKIETPALHCEKCGRVIPTNGGVVETQKGAKMISIPRPIPPRCRSGALSAPLSLSRPRCAAQCAGVCRARMGMWSGTGTLKIGLTRDIAISYAQVRGEE